MEIQTLLVLAITVFGSALLQAATGVGYGAIAGPVFLVVLNGAEAIQISTLHNLLIATLLFPLVRSSINLKLLWPIVVGSAPGIAAGFYLQTVLGTNCLKIVAVGMVFFVMVSLFLDLCRPLNQSRKADGLHGIESHLNARAAAVGAAAGVMGGALAMPGPLVATWMALCGFAKNQIRATVSAFFLFAYGATLLLYVLFTGLEQNTLRLSAGFAPLVLAGVFCGHFVAKYLSENLFRKILLLVLFATIVSLLASLLL